MDDLVERLITARDDDHERGCQMRFVVCSCGYDDQTARAVGDAKDRIEALQAALRLIAPMVDFLPHPHCIRAALVIRQALKGTDNAE